MASLNLDPLLTNIPLDETIDSCIGSLYKDNWNTSKSLKMIFIICLPWPPKIRFLFLTINSLKKLIVQLCGFH